MLIIVQRDRMKQLGWHTYTLNSSSYSIYMENMSSAFISFYVVLWKKNHFVCRNLWFSTHLRFPLASVYVFWINKWNLIPFTLSFFFSFMNSFWGRTLSFLRCFAIFYIKWSLFYHFSCAPSLFLRLSSHIFLPFLLIFTPLILFNYCRHILTCSVFFISWEQKRILIHFFAK